MADQTSLGVPECRGSEEMAAFVFFFWASPFIVAEVDGDAIVSDRSLARKSFGESFPGERGRDIFEKFPRTIVVRSLI